jgi:hypothetical protein
MLNMMVVWERESRLTRGHLHMSDQKFTNIEQAMTQCYYATWLLRSKDGSIEFENYAERADLLDFMTVFFMFRLLPISIHAS